MRPAGHSALSTGDLWAEKGFQPKVKSPVQLNTKSLSKTYENEVYATQYGRLTT